MLASHIYKATLSALGYEPVLFDFPVSALAWLAGIHDILHKPFNVSSLGAAIDRVLN